MTIKLSKIISSYPYISGDFISSLADYSVPNDLNCISVDEMCRAKILFIPSHHVEEVIKKYETLLHVNILLAGNSDYEFKKPNLVFPKNMKAAYLQNSFISDQERLFTLPIGIENIALARNGFKSTMKQTAFSLKLDRVLVGPFSPTSIERAVISDTFLRNRGPWDVIHADVPPYAYPKLLSQYKFVLCPPGNGVDTHRVWETIYRGGIPIVMDDEWSRSLANTFPIILAKSLTSASEMESIVKNNARTGKALLPKEAFGKYWKQLLNNNCT